jgi:hypothetical protein
MSYRGRSHDPSKSIDTAAYRHAVALNVIYLLPTAMVPRRSLSTATLSPGAISARFRSSGIPIESLVVPVTAIRLAASISRNCWVRDAADNVFELFRVLSIQRAGRLPIKGA